MADPKYANLPGIVSDKHAFDVVLHLQIWKDKAVMDYVLNMVNGVDENYIIMLNGLQFEGRIGGRKNSLLEADSIAFVVIFH